MNQSLIPQPLPYVAEFEKLGFGMFIHWGLYSMLEQGEWIMHLTNIPKEDIQKLAHKFTAEDFDARAIANLAKRAGMKYIVLTTRHHEGFSLYDTCGLNEYDAPHSAAKRDLIEEFVNGCRAEGIIPFFYHTTLDWNEPSFYDDFDSYLEYLNRSVEILCTRYGKIGGLWFDGNWSKPNSDWKEDVLYGIIRKHQPEAMIINNSGIQHLGQYGHPEIDSVTFEQGKPTPLDRRGQSKYVAAEMCETINGHWGIAKSDFSSKSVAQLIEHLCQCRKVGANYLLNIGPTATGKIVKLQEATLEAVGEWVAIYKEALYTAKPSEIAGSGNDFVLRGPTGKLYFFIHNLSVDGHANVTFGANGIGPRTFTGLQQTVVNMKWMDNGENLAFTQNVEGDLFSFYATGYPFGTKYVVRVAEAEILAEVTR